ncbi:hypothetical protein [Pedobacter hartonius]|nr:hypothetical protein [Pedobacter hartonius]
MRLITSPKAKLNYPFAVRIVTMLPRLKYDIRIVPASWKYGCLW